MPRTPEQVKKYHKAFSKRRSANFIDEIDKVLSKVESEKVLTELCEFYFKQFKQSYYEWSCTD